MNGEYLGNYIFCEKISLTDGRVKVQDISDYSESKIASGDYKDVNGDETADLQDGGFILEVDFRGDADFAFRTDRQLLVTLKDPDEVSTEIQEHIKDIVQTAEDELYSDDFSVTEEINGKTISKWMKKINIESVIDWYIVNDFLKNYDSPFITSVYMYYNPADGQLHMGPIWDYDGLIGEDTGWWTR